MTDFLFAAQGYPFMIGMTLIGVVLGAVIGKWLSQRPRRIWKRGEK